MCLFQISHQSALFYHTQYSLYIAKMQAFPMSTCKQHKECPTTHICFENNAKYICQNCVTRSQCCSLHQKYVLDIPSFIVSVGETATNLQKLEQKAMARHSELVDLASLFKVEYTKDDDELIKGVLKILQSENKQYKQANYRISSLRVKLMGASSLIRYFGPFHDSELFRIKMHLSTEKGLRRFFKRAQDHSALLNKGVHVQLKKIENQFLIEEKKLRELQQNSFIVLLKDSLRQRGDQSGKGTMKNIK